MRFRVITAERGVPDRYIVILIVVILISASLFSAWYFFVRPISVDELVLRNMSFKDGDVIKVAGKVSEIKRLNTTYGEITVLTLKGSKLAEYTFRFIGNSSRTYNIGDTFSTTLHFHTYTFNGKPVITAPELYSPFMFYPDSMQTVSDAASFIGGFELVPFRFDSKGATYRVFSSDNSSYPLEMINVSLRKSVLKKNYSGTIPDSILMMTEEYINIMDPYNSCDEIDYIPVLIANSENGLIGFTDTNLDNLLDEGDIFIINIPPTNDIHVIETYFLYIQGPGSEKPDTGISRHLFQAEKYIVNWYNGPYEVKSGGDSINSLSLSYILDGSLNGSSKSVIEVTGVEYPILMRYNDCEFRLVRHETDFFNGRFSETGVTDEKTGVSVCFIDSNNNSFIDKGDFITISGLERGSRAELLINEFQPSGLSGQIRWYAGYGHVSGNLPDISLHKSEEGSQCVVSVSNSYWHSELEFNHTIRFSIRNSSDYIIENYTLENGAVCSDPLNITFVDADSNQYLSDGDYFILSDFTLSCNYTISISVLFGNYLYERNLSPSYA